MRPEGKPTSPRPPGAPREQEAAAAAPRGASRAPSQAPRDGAAPAGAGGPPALSLPKGGGAIRGIGETFTANPVTGTGSMAVPLPLSPGRAGASPQLSLSYDSGSGNGPFGLGWSLGLPAIARKTDKGLPRYDDAQESDVFVLSGVEDLVPELGPNGLPLEREETLLEPGIAPDEAGPTEHDYTVRRYRPRVEGPFARIERWTRQADGDVHWRAISKDNVLSVYGKDPKSRVQDPADARRVFSWLLSETRDDRGNAVVYRYKAEDAAGVDLGAAHERNRGGPASAQRTANRYLKRVLYGNRVPLLDGEGDRPAHVFDEDLDDAGWMFEAVLDYGEHDAQDPKPDDPGAWGRRQDPFSTFRAGFEVRTYRLCRRVLMFHHFGGEQDVGEDCLVRSTTFQHQESPVATVLASVVQAGHRRSGGSYTTRALPPLEFEYSQPVVGTEILDVDPASVENLPRGADGGAYQWVDLDGEGLSGILSAQGGGWHYKRNEAGLTRDPATGRIGARFAPVEPVLSVPAGGAAPGDGAWQFLDLAGDGRTRLVSLAPPAGGFYGRAEAEGAQGWEPFRAFPSLPTRPLSDRSVKAIDLTGDGRPDLLVAGDQVLAWHPSLGEDGFAAEARVTVPLDEEQGPRLVLADGTETIFLADMSGDGLTDLVRIRNGEVCYWPNLGYGRFGAKVAMDHAPVFDLPEQFDPRRVRLADIDGSGATDFLYLGRNATRFWSNHSGNGWGPANDLPAFPPTDSVATVSAVDLLGDGTACLVWSSPLPAAARAPMKYVRLMATGKPHLLVAVRNNLGAETRIRYAPSTVFYLQDRRAGRPWLTKLPFPVHVVERVETHDRIARNRFVTRYAYHHGHYDLAEREFRGFGMVEQWDTEELSALGHAVPAPGAANVEPSSHVPPVLTRTWFHTGVHLGRQRLADVLAGLTGAGKGEYYREPNLTDPQAAALLLKDADLPADLTVEEEREACRALKGAMLRQETYARDGSANEGEPYTVVQQSFAVRLLQGRKGNRHAVFLVHPSESIRFHYERNTEPGGPDPRTEHTLTLEVDAFGNVLKQAAVAYGRRRDDLALPEPDRLRQRRTLATLTQTRTTGPIDDPAAHPGHYRTPLPCETLAWELTGYDANGPAGRHLASDFVDPDPADAAKRIHKAGSQPIPFEAEPGGGMRRRLLKASRVLYRPDDFGHAQGSALALLPLGEAGRRAFPGETFRLALTDALVGLVFRRDGQPLLPNPTTVLGAAGGAGGGYAASADLKASGAFPATDPDGQWWAPSGRSFLSPGSSDTPAQEAAYARQHFFLPRRFRDPFHTNTFGTETIVSFDDHDLLPVQSRDPVGNRVTVGGRLANGDPDPAKPGNDYRVLQPRLLTDPNGNRTEVAFDALGLVVGTAVRGKAAPAPEEGDSLQGFQPDLPPATVEAHMGNPSNPLALLGQATTRVLYDVGAYHRTRSDPQPKPPSACSIARETHASAPGGAATKVQQSFSHSDGFGREVQRKLQAEPDPAAGGNPPPPRWAGTGWTVFNNKGKPVRQYEPFFTATHAYEPEAIAGVSPVVFYDPAGRAVATLHPNAIYEKAVFTPWRQVAWDANDTVADDPRTDPDVAGFTAAWFATLAPPPGGWKTWAAQRQGGALGLREQQAAQQAAQHARTPTAAHFDPLGRPFLAFAHAGFAAGQPILHATRTGLDIEGQERWVRDAVQQAGDAQGRVVMEYDHDMLGNRVRQSSMDAGQRWTLPDVAGKPLLAWDSRGHRFRAEHDPLRRPLRSYVGTDPQDPGQEFLSERMVYGEQHPLAEARNLRGRVCLLYDQSGEVETEACDFKRNPVRMSRRIAAEHDGAIDWGAADAALPAAATAPFVQATLETALATAALLLAERFASIAAFDAMNRPVEMTTPATPAMQASVVRRTYNEASLLQAIGVRLRGAAAWTPFVANVDYDAKGQRTRVDYGNGASTSYTYDPLTFRLASLVTRRTGAVAKDDCPNPPKAAWPGCNVQNLRYTYDPVGNVTHVRDEAQQEVFFGGQWVEPSAEYTYDPLYRLVEAHGREHLGQQNGAPTPYTHDDAGRVGLAQPNNGALMGNYRETYAYDEAGNILSMAHFGPNPANPAWSRAYAYTEASLLEDGSGPGPAKAGNRLTSTTVQGTANYLHDAHGNMTRMPHLADNEGQENLFWDHRDRLSRVETRDAGTAYYRHDAGGQRVRKVQEKSGGIVEERLYLGGFEVFRRRKGQALLERETLHVLDGGFRVALVETRTQDTAGADKAPPELVRYQFGNHLGSASLELDGDANVLSYEEFSPFGSTTYQGTTQAELPKRYRFTGKERDEESGLDSMGVRFYAAWLGRWSSADPAGLADGPNLYAYARANPVRYSDPTGTQSDEELPNQALDLLKNIGIQTDHSESESGGGILEGIGDFFGSLGQGVKDAMSAAWEWVKGAASAAWEWTKKAASTIWEGVKGAANAAWEWTKKAASAAWEWTKQVASAAWEWTKKAASAVWEWTKKAASAAWEWTKKAASDFWNWFAGDDGFLEDTAEVIGHLTWGLLGTTVGLLVTAFNLTIGNIVTGIHNLFTSDADDWEYAGISIGGPNDEDDIIGNYGGLFNLGGLGAAVTLGPFVFFQGSLAEAKGQGSTGVRDFFRTEAPGVIYGSKQNLRTADHEEGHEDQNLAYGPFTLIFGVIFSLLPNAFGSSQSSGWFWYDRQANRWSGKNNPSNPNPNVHP